MARVRARVAASVAASTGAAAAIPAKAATGLGLKLGVSALVLGAVAAGIVLTRPSSPRAAAPSIAIGSAEADQPNGVVQVAATEPAPAPSATVEAAPTARPSVAPARPSQASAAAPTEEPVSLAREVELIDRAMLLVRRGDAREALTVIATYQRETRGDGQMAEDAAAIDIEARCGLHEDVTARLARFDRVWPTSAQRSRLQDRCFAR
jgi:hypothetical protein